MTLRITGAVAALAVSLAGAAAANAQTRDQEVTAATAQLMEQLNLLGEAVGIERPVVPAEVLASALGAALPMLPAGDARDWNSSFAFDFKTDVTTGTPEADEEGRTVLTDARSCVADEVAAEVVHFTRFTRGAVRGHRCIIAADSNGVRVLQSQTFAQGPDRRLTAYYGVATIVEGDPAETRRLMDEHLDQNVALAGMLADYALEIFLSRQAGETRDEEAFAVRVERLTERLAEIAAAFEAAP